MGDELNFNFDEKEEVFEDIVSDSSKTVSEEQVFLMDNGDKHTKRKKHKKGKAGKKRLSGGKRALIIIGAVALLLAAVIVINPFHMLERMLYNFDNISEDSEQYGFDTKIDKDIINIALFGIDARKTNTFSGNSDSIMVLSINTLTKKVKIMSVVRDTIVSIVDKNGNRHFGKINAAYANSPETAIRTLNETFDLDISEYAVVNFYGMSEIIDAVGGIDIEVTPAELRYYSRSHLNLNQCIDEICKHLGVNSSKYHITTPGKHHVNGIQAVGYSRIRIAQNIWGTNNDYGRTDRQRHVMEQLFNKAVKLKKSDYPKLAKSLIPCTKTSLDLNQVIAIAYSVMLDKPTFYQVRFPQEDWLMRFRWPQYGSVVYYDLGYASRVMHAIIYDDKTVEEFVAENPVEKNDWFATGSYPRKSTNTATASSAKQSAS